MEPENLTVRVLMDIRDDVRGLRGDVAGLREEQVRMREELTSIGERLSTVEGAVVDIAGQLRLVGRSIGVSRAARRQHERRLDDLEHRVSALERKG